MRLSACILGSLLVVPTYCTALDSATHVAADNDPYFTRFVSSAFQFVADPPNRPVASFEFKKFTHSSPSLLELGDGVTIAVLKLLDRKELLVPKNTSAYLILVRNAFSYKEKVKEKSNLEPKATLFVLDYLAEKSAADPVTSKRIFYLQFCVLDFSCSPEGEHYYVTKPPLPQPAPPRE